jgi:transposase
MKKADQIRRTFTKEFKQDAVKMITEQGHSIAEVAKNLGISYNVLCRWKKELSESSSVEVDALKLELKRLQKENKRLEMEREILKKAAAFFAKESQ